MLCIQEWIYYFSASTHRYEKINDFIVCLFWVENHKCRDWSFEMILLGILNVHCEPAVVIRNFYHYVTVLYLDKVVNMCFSRMKEQNTKWSWWSLKTSSSTLSSYLFSLNSFSIIWLLSMSWWNFVV